MNKQKSKSLIDRWEEWIKGRSKSRPSNEFSYGKGMDKVTMKLPRSVEEQFKMVTSLKLLDQYPNDYKLRVDFFNLIAPYGTILNQPVSMELLGYTGVETYISMYSDLLLRPLHQGAVTKIQEAIMEILPTIAESTK